MVIQICSVLILVSISLRPAMAQEGMPPLPGELVLGDLGAPRGLAFDANGNLLVAVAGTGGETEFTMLGPEGESTVNAGLSSGDVWHTADYSDHWQQLPINMGTVWTAMVML